MFKRDAWQGGLGATLYQWWLGANYALSLLGTNGEGMSRTQMDMGLATLQRIPLLQQMLAKKILWLAILAATQTEAAAATIYVPLHERVLARVRLVRAHVDAKSSRQNCIIPELEWVMGQLSTLRTQTDRYSQLQFGSILIHAGMLCEEVGGIFANKYSNLYIEALHVADTQGATRLGKKVRRLLVW